MYRMRSARLRNASMMELMPSPTMPNACVAPQAIKVSTRMSAVVSSPSNAGIGCGDMELRDSVSGVAARACAVVRASAIPAAAAEMKSRRSIPLFPDIAFLHGTELLLIRKPDIRRRVAISRRWRHRRGLGTTFVDSAQIAPVWVNSPHGAGLTIRMPSCRLRLGTTAIWLLHSDTILRPELGRHPGVFCSDGQTCACIERESTEVEKAW